MVLCKSTRPSEPEIPLLFENLVVFASAILLQKVACCSLGAWLLPLLLLIFLFPFPELAYPTLLTGIPKGQSVSASLLFLFIHFVCSRNRRYFFAKEFPVRRSSHQHLKGNPPGPSPSRRRAGPDGSPAGMPCNRCWVKPFVLEGARVLHLERCARTGWFGCIQTFPAACLSGASLAMDSPGPVALPSWEQPPGLLQPLQTCPLHRKLHVESSL